MFFDWNVLYILVPIYIPKSEDVDEAVKKSGFDEIISTVGALSIQDERIVEQLRGITEGRKPNGGGSPIDGITKLAKTIKIDPKDFEESVQLKIWNKITFGKWRPFKEARDFIHSQNIKNAFQ